MPTTLSNAQVSCAITATVTGGAAPAPLVASVGDVTAQSLSSGTSGGSVDKCYSAAFAVASGTPLVLDLSSLTDPAAGAIAFLHVNAIKLTNQGTNTGQDLTLGGGSNPLFAALSTPARANGGVLLIHDPNPGIAVNASTAHNLQISAASGSSVAGSITILGRSV